MDNMNIQDVPSDLKMVNHWEMMVDGVTAVNHTAQSLWERAVMYFQWCDDHPIPQREVLRSGLLAGKMIAVPVPRPYTIAGLCLHLGISRQYLYDAINSTNKNEFSFVAERIAEVIYTQKLELAISGVYNPIVVAKELALGTLKDDGKKSSTINIEVVGNSPKLLRDEVDANLPVKNSDSENQKNEIIQDDQQTTTD